MVVHGNDARKVLSNLKSVRYGRCTWNLHPVKVLSNFLKIWRVHIEIRQTSEPVLTNFTRVSIKPKFSYNRKISKPYWEPWCSYLNRCGGHNDGRSDGRENVNFIIPGPTATGGNGLEIVKTVTVYYERQPTDASLFIVIKYSIRLNIRALFGKCSILQNMIYDQGLWTVFAYAQWSHQRWLFDMNILWTLKRRLYSRNETYMAMVFVLLVYVF